VSTVLHWTAAWVAGVVAMFVGLTLVITVARWSWNILEFVIPGAL